MKTVISADPPVNQAPPNLDPARDLPRGLYDFLLPLHRAFSPRQRDPSRVEAVPGKHSSQDKRREREVAINESKTVSLTRPRGLHLEQAGVIKGERMAAALFDVAIVAYQVDPSRLKHPLSIYIAK